MNLNPYYNPLMLFAFFIMALGGCLDAASLDEEGSTTAEPEKNLPTEPAPKAKATKESGSLEGQVADDEFRPIHGALVSLVNQTGPVLEALTDRDGKYTINDVPPGEYGVLFSADCCEDHLDRVRIEPGQVKRVSATLQVWVDHRTPYVIVDEWEGFLSCYVGEHTNAGGYATCSALDENHDDRHDFEITRGIHTLLVAMQWQDGFNLNDCLHLGLIVQPGHDEYSWGTQLAESDDCEQSPIEFRVDAGEMYEIRPNSLQEKGSYDFENITDHMPLRFQVGAEKGLFNSGAPNIVYQQSFSLYWEEHYWDYAPPGASALPNSP